MVSEKIFSQSYDLKILVEKLGLKTLVGKDRKNALKPYKFGNYHEWVGGGYVKRPVYKYEDAYYS